MEKWKVKKGEVHLSSWGKKTLSEATTVKAKNEGPRHKSGTSSPGNKT